MSIFTTAISIVILVLRKSGIRTQIIVRIAPILLNTISIPVIITTPLIRALLTN